VGSHGERERDRVTGINDELMHFHFSYLGYRHRRRADANIYFFMGLGKIEAITGGYRGNDNDKGL
jgi:hypothetical protein